MIVVVCALSFVHGQEARQAPQHQSSQQEEQAAPKPWGSVADDGASPQADAKITVEGVSPLDSTSTHASTAISEVQGSFKVYPNVVGAKPLPTTGKWSVPTSPSLAFLPACKASKASCLEVQYSVASRNVVCLWTVLFPAPVTVKGKQVQTPTVINEDSNAAQYTMLVRLQTGMNYASVATVAPLYPPGAKSKDWTGAVSVDIIVSQAGKVVSILDVRGPDGLKPSARQAVSNWVYGQTKVNGQAVARSFTVQVNYSVGVRVNPT